MYLDEITNGLPGNKVQTNSKPSLKRRVYAGIAAYVGINMLKAALTLAQYQTLVHEEGEQYAREFMKRRVQRMEFIESYSSKIVTPGKYFMAKWLSQEHKK